MSKRNMIWLAVVVVIGGVVWLIAGFLWGLLAAVVTLVVSEVIERTARQRRLNAKGAAPATPIRDAVKRTER